MLGSNKISVGHAKLIIGLTEDEQKIIVDSIVGQKLTVRESEELVKKIKDRHSSTNTKNISSSNIKNNFNYEVLQNVTKRLSDDDLSVKVDKNYFKIKISSQEDIEKIAKYFQIV